MPRAPDGPRRPTPTPTPQFVADGVFYAELNELLVRELAEDGYSGVEVRQTPMRTEIIIRATRTQNVLGEKQKGGPAARRRRSAGNIADGACASGAGAALVGTPARSHVQQLQLGCSRQLAACCSSACDHAPGGPDALRAGSRGCNGPREAAARPAPQRDGGPAEGRRTALNLARAAPPAAAGANGSVPPSWIWPTAATVSARTAPPRGRRRRRSSSSSSSSSTSSSSASPAPAAASHPRSPRAPGQARRAAASAS
jgi:hypothetical protein